MDHSIQDKVSVWLSGNYDQATKSAIANLQPDELADSFYRNLEFGTGGLRGIMGVGTNRMNKYTVGMATQGFANYLKKTYGNDPVSVVIGHDSRNNSRFFAETTAGVFAANGIQVYLFEALRPTPELSFAIRKLGCKAGVVCTASHNPKEYNGYKAYWNDGGQLVPPHDKNVITEVEAIQSVDEVKWSGGEDNIKLLGNDASLKIQTLEKTQIESLKMGGLLSVNKGSIDPPTFTIMEYKPKNAKNKKPVLCSTCCQKTTVLARYISQVLYTANMPTILFNHQ